MTQQKRFKTVHELQQTRQMSLVWRNRKQQLILGIYFAQNLDRWLLLWFNYINAVQFKDSSFGYIEMFPKEDQDRFEGSRIKRRRKKFLFSARAIFQTKWFALPGRRRRKKSLAMKKNNSSKIEHGEGSRRNMKEEVVNLRKTDFQDQEISCSQTKSEL